jgi:hypothetical protein
LARLDQMKEFRSLIEIETEQLHGGQQQDRR